MTLTRFAVGSATAYVTDAVLALSDTSVIDEELMRVCATSIDWAVLTDAARQRHVTALVLLEAGCVRLAVTRGASIVVGTVAGDRHFDGTDGWMTDTVGQAHGVSLIARAGCGPGEAAYIVDGGVVPAALLSRRLAASAPDDPIELLFGPTTSRSVESAAVRRVADLAERRAADPVLVFDTGERVIVDRSLLLGRNPHPVDDMHERSATRVVRLPYPGVSRRHAVIRLDRWAPSIEDLGSSNGTTVSSPATPEPNVLRPGRPVGLTFGDVVDLGGGASFVVEQAA